MLAESSSQSAIIVNGKVVDKNNSFFKLQSDDNKKFDMDIIENDKGILVRELKKKDLLKALKGHKKNTGESLVEKLSKLSKTDFKKASKSNRRRSKKKRNKGKAKTEKKKRPRY